MPQRVAFILGLIAALAAVAWRYPLFHVVPLGSSPSEKFDAKAFAETFWDDKLVPAFADAHDAATVLAALASDAAVARKTYGRVVGISRSTFFFIRGKGTVVVADGAHLGVALDVNGVKRTPVDASARDLFIKNGPVFGNAVRDCTGLIRSEEFENSQDFNTLSVALNGLVTERVLSKLRDLITPGRRVEFVACVEVSGGAIKLPLFVTPLSVTLY